MPRQYGPPIARDGGRLPVPKRPPRQVRFLTRHPSWHRHCGCPRAQMFSFLLMPHVMSLVLPVGNAD